MSAGWLDGVSTCYQYVGDKCWVAGWGEYMLSVCGG